MDSLFLFPASDSEIDAFFFFIQSMCYLNMNGTFFLMQLHRIRPPLIIIGALFLSACVCMCACMDGKSIRHTFTKKRKFPTKSRGKRKVKKSRVFFTPKKSPLGDFRPHAALGGEKNISFSPPFNRFTFVFFSQSQAKKSSTSSCSRQIKGGRFVGQCTFYCILERNE